jgi:hypothetical protein
VPQGPWFLRQSLPCRPLNKGHVYECLRRSRGEALASPPCDFCMRPEGLKQLKADYNIPQAESDVLGTVFPVAVDVGCFRKPVSRQRNLVVPVLALSPY